ncbi:MAG TPA: hypothetical protein VGN37_04505 [Actinocatenispora sp.]
MGPLSQGGIIPLGQFGEGLQGNDCSITNRGPDNSCGYHEPGDDPDDSDYDYCAFAASSEPAQCSWSLSVLPSAPLGRIDFGIKLYLDGYPRSGGAISQATGYLTIGTTSTHPSASATTPHPSQTASGGLPVTGTSLPLYGGLAAVLLGGGAGLVLLARRRTKPVRR